MVKDFDFQNDQSERKNKTSQKRCKKQLGDARSNLLSKCILFV